MCCVCVHCASHQIETREALANLEAIAAVDGVDGVFIGPSDLAADMGHLANPVCAGRAAGAGMI